VLPTRQEKNNKMEDIYIAIEFPKRNESVEAFTQKYLKGFKETNGYYEYPPFTGETEFETDDYKLMRSYVLQREKSDFRFYFENAANKETPFAMMFFNEDGSLYLGLGVYSQFASKYEQKLKDDFKSSLIMFCYNTIPPDNLTEFKSIGSNKLFSYKAFSLVPVLELSPTRNNHISSRKIIQAFFNRGRTSLTLFNGPYGHSM